MTTISFARHQFPPDIIRHAVWLYLRFTLSFRDVEDLLAELRVGCLLRDGQAMGVEVRAVVRQGTSPQTSSIDRAVASRRECAAKASAMMWWLSCMEDEGRPLEADRQG